MPVQDPTPEQRKDLPKNAYEPSAFVEDGEFLSSKSKLPHHINTVKNPNDNESVDVPRLRNALARFDQVDWSGFPSGTEAKSKAHLERHADAVLKTRRENSGLALDLSDFRKLQYNSIRARHLIESVFVGQP